MVGFGQLFFSYFKDLVGREVTVELKNDLAIRGTLHSVDQYLNIKLENTRVVDQDKYPHMVNSLFLFNFGVSSFPFPFLGFCILSLIIIYFFCFFLIIFNLKIDELENIYIFILALPSKKAATNYPPFSLGLMRLFMPMVE